MRQYYIRRYGEKWHWTIEEEHQWAADFDPQGFDTRAEVIDWLDNRFRLFGDLSLIHELIETYYDIEQAKEREELPRLKLRLGQAERENEMLKDRVKMLVTTLSEAEIELERVYNEGHRL